jgi:hypothetical protein
MKSNAHKCRRKIVVAEISILRKFEGRDLMQNKIDRQMSKLHLLWFKGSAMKICTA